MHSLRLSRRESRSKRYRRDIQALDEKISACQDEDDEETLEAPVSGRVKLIYAQTGDDTADVMLENGALISGTQVTGTAAFLWKDIFRTLR